MIFYEVARANVALSTVADLLSIVTGANRSILITEYEFWGDGLTSGANDIGLYRVGTPGVTGSGVLNPTPLDLPNISGSGGLQFSGEAFTAWVTQPILSAELRLISVNENGARTPWRCMQNLADAIPVPGGGGAQGSVSLRGINAAGPISFRLKFAEI